MKAVKKRKPEEPVTWEQNLVLEDEAAGFRARQVEWELAQKKEKEPSEGSSDEKKKKPKKKKKKKEKLKQQKKEEAAAEGSKPSSCKIGGRSSAKKSIQDLYGGTGLDPDPKIRKKVGRKVRKKLKRTKESSSSSGSSSSSESTSMMEEDTLEDRSKVFRIAQLGPGLLAGAAIKSMKPYVLQVQGSTWEEDQTTIPPIMAQYCRSFLAPKASGGLQREVATLCHNYRFPPYQRRDNNGLQIGRAHV